MWTHDQRLQFAIDSLEGLAMGDAFGESLSYRFYEARDSADFSLVSDGSLTFTDDTEMGIAVVKTLALLQGMDSDAVAFQFVRRFQRDPGRGYGKMARRILQELAAGEDWRVVSPNAFGGGSFGNGAAMRVAPLGAYLGDDSERIIAAATQSARVTHYHPEGIAGAIAVALAAGVARENRHAEPARVADSIREIVLEFTPGSKTADRIRQAFELGATSTEAVAQTVGNGAEITAQDTVPFCIWNACRCLADFPEALFSTVEVGGDCDTNCAIVGGIVSSYLGRDAIPSGWIRVREPLPRF